MGTTPSGWWLPFLRSLSSSPFFSQTPIARLTALFTAFHGLLCSDFALLLADPYPAPRGGSGDVLVLAGSLIRGAMRLREHLHTLREHQFGQMPFGSSNEGLQELCVTVRHARDSCAVEKMGIVFPGDARSSAIIHD